MFRCPGCFFVHLFAVALCLLLGTCHASTLTRDLPQLQQRYDVVIAGAGTGGAMAAVQAARLGASVLLTEDTDWIGGQMSAAAVTSMDEGPPGSRFGEGRLGARDRGLYREFCERAVAHYAKLGLSVDTCYVSPDRIAVEPRVGQAIFLDMLRDASLSGTLHLALCTTAKSVVRDEMKVTGVELVQDIGNGPTTRTIECAVLVDATELGDLLPLTGARYRVGNLVRSGPWQQPDDNATSAPANPPLQDNTWTAVIRAYHTGSVPPELTMQQQPPEYDRALFAKALDNPLPRESRSPWNWERFICYRGMPDSTNPDKTIRNPWARVTRTHMNAAVNDVPMTVRDLEEPQRWLRMQRDLKLRTLQLLHYIRHDMKEPMTSWTVANDEGYDSAYNRRQNRQLADAFPELKPHLPVLDHFPVKPYVRESRRLVGMQTLRARDIDRRAGPRRFAHSVAIGDYPADLHGGRNPEDLEADLDSPEDRYAIGFTPDRMGAFTIPFEVFVPETLDGFLAAEKNISQSRLTNGATRLQPSTMLTGQAAGAIAALSAQHAVQPRHLRPAVVQAALLGAGDILFAARGDLHRFAGVEPRTELWNATQLALLYGVLEPGEGTGGMQAWKTVSSGTQGWQSKADGAMELAGGMSAAVLQTNADGTPVRHTADGSVTGVFTLPKDVGHAGLIGRFRDADNFCSARIYRQNLELLQWKGGRVETMSSRTLAEAGIAGSGRLRLTARFKGTHFEATLAAADGKTSVSVSADGIMNVAGLAGVRAQAGASPVRIDGFELRDSKGRLLAKPHGQSAIDMTSAPLARGRLAMLLLRQFPAAAKTHQEPSLFADVPTTHPAHHAVQALAGAGALGVTTTPQGLLVCPDDAATRADLAVALVRLLNLPSAAAGQSYDDLPASHPAHAAACALHAARVAPRFFATDSRRFRPDEKLRMADYVTLFHEMLTTQPPDVRQTRYPGMVD